MFRSRLFFRERVVKAKLPFFFTFDQEFFVQAMWAAPLCQTFLHLLYDKEILEEPMILQWYSRKPAGGEDSGFEPQRKQLRQQVCHLSRDACLVFFEGWSMYNLPLPLPTHLLFNVYLYTAIFKVGSLWTLV